MWRLTSVYSELPMNISKALTAKDTNDYQSEKRGEEHEEIHRNENSRERNRITMPWV